MDSIDGVGAMLEAGDFNGDGYGDLVVGVGRQIVDLFDYDRKPLARTIGSVHVYYGGPSGFGLGQLWHAGVTGFEEPLASDQDRLKALEVGDFNHDAYPDLVILWSGTLRLLYGGPGGLSAANHAGWTVQGATAAAAGDFNGDGIVDLAIGRGSFSTPTRNSPGALDVMYGGTSGLGSGPVANQTFTQSHTYFGQAQQDLDNFGASLAAGNFNGDAYDDLAIGSPGEAEGAERLGSVSVAYGAQSGLGTAGDERASQLITQTTLGFTSDLKRPRIGTVLTAADVTGDGVDELAIALPFRRKSSSVQYRGEVTLLFGVPSQRLRTEQPQRLTWSITGLASGNADEVFGSRVAAGHFDQDALADLALGFNGGLDLLHGSTTGVGRTAAKKRLLQLQHFGTVTGPAPGVGFGTALAQADFNADGIPDMAVSSPGQTDASFSGEGTVTILYGSSTNASGAWSISTTGSHSFHANLCSYAQEPDDCQDVDGDGIFAGVERLAGSRDDRVDSDADGIPDRTELRTYDPVLVNGRYSVNKRSNPGKPTVYVVLAHSSALSLAQADALRIELTRYFAADTATLEVQIVTRAVAPNHNASFLSACATAEASQEQAPNLQAGWVTQATMDQYLAGAPVETLAIAPYAHLGRICVADTATTPLKGVIQYQGGWQFVVRAKPAKATWSADQQAMWLRALGSLTAHQLGHSLGLGHGGDNEDDCNPLYPSVMNHGYDFQVDGDPACREIGFSPGRLAAPPPAKQLELVAGNGESTGTIEYDVLRDVKDERGQPLTLPQLDFLACWGRGDYEGPTDSSPVKAVDVGPCPVGAATYCANWDQDEFWGAEESEDVLGQYESVDRPYDAVSVAQARTGGRHLAEGFISGCAAEDLEGATPLTPLHDHDDFQIARDLLGTTLRRDGCGTGSCTSPVVEPPTALRIDVLRDMW